LSVESSDVGSSVEDVHEKPYEGYAQPVTVASAEQVVVPVIGMQQYPVLPSAMSVGSLQTSDDVSGVASPVQVKPSEVPEQPSVSSAPQVSAETLTDAEQPDAPSPAPPRSRTEDSRNTSR
jgi:hypothetical protein